MIRSLLDTDIFSEVFKNKDPNVGTKAIAYLSQFGKFSISAITKYEALRGLKSKNATVQLRSFEIFCKNTDILEITDEVLVIASDLWAIGKQSGCFAEDADLIIAATAMVDGRTLVTGNQKHFDWIQGLAIDNWRIP